MHLPTTVRSARELSNRAPDLLKLQHPNPDNLTPSQLDRRTESTHSLHSALEVPSQLQLFVLKNNTNKTVN